MEKNETSINFEELNTSKYIFDENFKELIKLIKLYESDPSIWSREREKDLDLMQKDFIRLLHNYLASFYSLKEHIYYFRDKLGNEEIRGFCNEEFKKFSTDSLMSFVRDLRTYTQHYKSLPYVASVVFTIKGKTITDPSNLSLSLEVEELLKWKNWSSLSCEYLNDCKEIELTELIVMHHKLVNSFYEKLNLKVLSLK